MITYQIHSCAGDVDVATDGGDSNPGRFELATADDGNSYTLKNPYYDIGGRTYAVPGSLSVALDYTGIVALWIDLSRPAPSASLSRFGSLSDMQAAQQNYGGYVLPLYQLEEGSVVCDFRIGPPAVAWEFTG